jgi:hypothetical protein
MKSGARLQDKKLSRAWFLAAAPIPEATAVNARPFVVAGGPDKVNLCFLSCRQPLCQ